MKMTKKVSFTIPNIFIDNKNFLNNLHIYAFSIFLD